MSKYKLANYWDAWALGRRKTAIANVFLKKFESGKIEVNHTKFEQYFKWETYRLKATQPLAQLGLENNFLIKINVKGGGLSGQADAIRLALANALSLFDYKSRNELRKVGLVTRDSRIKERKKVGFKKARKRKQYSKR
ncbi:30S ribosomal protein S9 [Oleiphilus messinensis]|uniref:30S ribosomal protein S9 n=1 Tax=Oleiphilus messinensis TaxID=141451 RepID=UPI001E3B1496|nr:30S ribosomal protein S9 [Oleiphilus messinensis]